LRNADPAFKSEFETVIGQLISLLISAAIQLREKINR
jgi:hypothetical protein